VSTGLRSTLGLGIVGTLVLATLGGVSLAQDEEPIKDQVNLVDAVAPANPLVPPTRDEIELRVELTTKELTVATGEQNQLNRELGVATSAAAELAEETAQVADETLRSAIDAYRQSAVPESIFALDDLTESIRASSLRNAAVSADTESFDAFRDLRKDLELEQAELLDKQTRSELANAEVTTLEEQLENELLWFSQLEERRLSNRAAVVAAQASYRAQYRGRKQGYILDTCPVNGPHSFIDSWGFARSGGRRHKGVDILADVGVELVAPVSGTVQHFSNSIGGRSYRLFANDGTGNYFYGTHLSAFGKQGEVEAGEVIGYVGEDGNAAGIPHLHFEIHLGGRGNPINPFIDSAAVCSGAIY